MSPPCRFEDTAVLGPSCGAGFALFMSLVEAVLRSRCDVSDACRRAGRDAARVLRDGDAADYVVVGAGVAGPVVAARLAEEPGVSVLLLEAGPEEPTSTQVPCFATHAVGTSLDWNFTTTRQEGACLATGGVCRWPRGKMVAGTGGMHGMMYTRGHRGCYDGWARAGNPGWRYDDVLPYFKKAERNLNPDQVRRSARLASQAGGGGGGGAEGVAAGRWHGATAAVTGVPTGGGSGRTAEQPAWHIAFHWPRSSRRGKSTTRQILYFTLRSVAERGITRCDVTSTTRVFASRERTAFRKIDAHVNCETLSWHARVLVTGDAAAQMEMEFHGAEGAMPVQQFPHRPAMSEVIVAALQSMGYRRGDLNGANQTGVNVAQMMVEGGLRASTARVYLRPLHNSTRLRVAIGAHVTRVLIDPASRRARGVEYVDGAGATKRALARREVILSAGAIGSPQLLMLSGVGPSEHLTALGIKTVRDLPVGENLHNHVSAGLGFWVRSPGPGRRALNADTLDAFLRTRGGPMASTGLTQTTAFVLSQYAKDGVPDLQMFFDGYSARCSRAGEPGECESDSCGPAYVLARPTAVRVESRGRLRLRSADPRAPPLLDPRYLSRPRDLAVLADGLRLAARAAATPPMRAWGVAVDDAPRPGCRHLPFASDQYWRCVARVHTGPENHQAGTCKMGPSWDYTAVVDARLRVHGVAALRVVDASIFPEVPNGNPVAPIIMVAEKAADMIKEDWRRAHQH
ncbi:glucose dehydrogenase [FAD, quinone]-like [Schistocerca gregaria]|uniref:glucose dehydrogenase [FAD, quinone]-like n=1 Tax=Schistocerca gregaria TaxID=7010 RepID=UPI00211E3340|nr:glucose dehydrogenase [FAD, quinone]-like [Schistocerca gregaria]